MASNATAGSKYIGTMENKIETTIAYWSYIYRNNEKMETRRKLLLYVGVIGILEEEMETTI